MGYTHGFRWTDEKIKETILIVKKELEIDRMPTRKEVIEYYNNHALSTAISRRYGGWYGLANELGLPIKNSETMLGKKHERCIKNMLENNGYIVTHMPQNFPYDLLINDCVKVDVKVSHLYRGRAGNFYTFRTGKKYATCDIYVLVALDDYEKTTKTYIIPSSNVITNTQISIGEFTSKYDVYIDKWSTIDEYSKFLKGGSL